MIYLLYSFTAHHSCLFIAYAFLIHYFQLGSCIKNGTASGSSQEHLLRGPFLARLYGTEASLQKEDSTTEGNRYLTSHTHTTPMCVRPMCFYMV
jgi:hypothetical protein